jgi:P4 family phage/plasmid primase-like protien
MGVNDIIDLHLNFDLVSPAFTSGLLADYFSVIYSQFVSKDGEVFEYTGVYWQSMDKKNAALHNFIDTTFYKHLILYANKVMNSTSAELATATPEKIQYVDGKIAKINDFIKKVQSIRKLKVRREIVDDIVNKLQKKDLEFDTDPYLFAFENKVYDLHQCDFIIPSPSQWIHTTCGYSYEDVYAPYSVFEMNGLIESILPEKAVRDYYLSALATGLSGLRMENIFISTGTGGNGKSLLNGMMMETVGNHGYKLPSVVIMEEIKEGANPAVANLHKKRFVLVQEPNSKRKMSSTTLKEITGDKKINARMMYSDNCNVILAITLALECNDIPDIPDTTGAIHRRVKIIPFITKAVVEEVYEALDDTTGYCIQNGEFKEDLWQSEHRQALFEILLPHWKAFRDRGNVLPPLPTTCATITSGYLADNDALYTWFNDHYEKTDEKVFIYIDVLYEAYALHNANRRLNPEETKNSVKKTFYKNMETNVFLSQYYKIRKQRAFSTTLTKPAIIGFKLRVEEEEEDIHGLVIDFEEMA